MYCPKCRKNTNHADCKDGTFCCLHCNFVHDYVPSGGIDPKMAAANDDTYVKEEDEGLK